MTPLFMKDAVLTIDSNNFQAEVSKVELTPSSSTSTWKGLTPAAVYTNTSAATWTAALTFAQDWDDPNSLSRFLFEHEGETFAAVFAPKAGGQAFTVNIVVTPGAIGGQVDAFSEGTVTLGVAGRPVYVTPVTP